MLVEAFLYEHNSASPIPFCMEKQPDYVIRTFKFHTACCSHNQNVLYGYTWHTRIFSPPSCESVHLRCFFYSLVHLLYLFGSVVLSCLCKQYSVAGSNFYYQKFQKQIFMLLLQLSLSLCLSLVVVKELIFISILLHFQRIIFFVNFNKKTTEAMCLCVCL